AWADIQQLPAPWDTPAPTTAPPAPLQVVEFGQLDLSSKSEPKPAEKLVVEVVEDLSDIESTELDDPDDEFVIATGAPPSPTEKNAAERGCIGVTANPFAEEFDEEEVVIDSFASWDDMFRREAPRVQNRRDPEFASLVQSALSPAVASELEASPKSSAALRMLGADFDEFEIDTKKKPAVEMPRSSNDGADWPPLRIAIVPESTSGAVDLGPAAPESHSREWNVPQPRDDGRSWTRRDAAPQVELTDDISPADGEAVLIVEDDNPTPKSPVRREEYRNLFSRLRSG
ncbi:MAG TPA: hypothetical protein VH107_16415, partial [Lacipirellulaceae bacterium]|nr:hypothetical protein [Lacipirellulaceae bacterium]